MVEDTRHRYNGLNQLVQSGDEIFYYDAQGNVEKKILPDSETDYHCSNENELLKVEQKHRDGTPLKTITSQYNSLGQKIRRTLNKADEETTTTKYVNST